MTIVSVCDWGARLDGMVNASEQPINTVIFDRLKTLISLSQKARSWPFLSLMERHGQNSYR